MLRWMLFFLPILYGSNWGIAQEALSPKELAQLLEQTKPGPEHARLKKFVGTWSVSEKSGGKDTGFKGEGMSEMILGDRFLVIDAQGQSRGQNMGFRYTIGFDRRHDEFTIELLDTTGTYPAFARGKATTTGCRTFGTDNDPAMQKLGLTKKFAFDLAIKSDDEFSLATLWVDTRTKEEKLIPAFEYVFTRKPPKP